MRVSIAIYDRNNNSVFVPRIADASDLRYTTGLPGGYIECSFTLPLRLRAYNAIAPGQRVVVYYGNMVAWEGFVADIERGTTTITVTAFGAWATLSRRRASFTVPYSYTAYDVIRYILRHYSQYVGGSYQYIDDPGIPLIGLGWEQANLQTIINDCLPKDWHFAVWESTLAEASGEITRTIADSGEGISYNDAFDCASMPYNPISGQIEFGQEDGAIRTAGLRFTNITLPRYTAILSATLTIYSAHGPTKDVHVRLHAEDTSNAVDFENIKPSERELSYAYVNWDPEIIEIDEEYNIDVTDLVQEVIDRDDWRSGNALALIIIDNGSRYHSAFYAFEGDSTKAARLTITYGAPDNATVRFYPHLFQRPVLERENVNYLVFAADIENLRIITSTSELYNSVTARYGMNLYTSPAEDADSIAKYGRMENDPAQLDAGSGASIETAQNMRDAFLLIHKDPRTGIQQLTVKRLYSRYGYPVPIETVRAGSVIRIADLTDFASLSSFVYYVLQTEYYNGMLTLTLDKPISLTELLGASSGEGIIGPYFAIGTIVAFDRLSYTCSITVDGQLLNGVDVAHEIGWWLLEPNKTCLVLFRGVNRNPETAVVVAVFEGRPRDIPYFDPAIGHRHTGAYDDGPVLS